MCHGISRVLVPETWPLTPVCEIWQSRGSDTTEGLHYVGDELALRLADSSESQAKVSDSSPQSGDGSPGESVARDMLLPGCAATCLPMPALHS
jgi:hypothetical protein